MPAGSAVTVPAPLVVTVSTNVRMNVADTVLAALIVTMQVPTPEQPEPLHPEKTEFSPGAAVRVTIVPTSKPSTQSEPQLMTLGELVTVPPPPPVRLTVRLNGLMKVAVTLMAPLTVTMQVPIPGHAPPLQPENAEPTSAVAVRTSTVPKS